MLIPSSWNFVDLWLEEEESVQSGRKMEQILWVAWMNYSEYSLRWKRWNMRISRASYKKMEQIGFYGTTSHLLSPMWERSGNAKLDLKQLFWKDCWRLEVTPWMMNHSEHWWLKFNLWSTQYLSLWRPSVTQKAKYNFHQVTSLQSKRVLPCLHQVNSSNRIHTQKWDGDVYNILQENSGVDGEMNFFRVYNQGRYGKVGFETLQFVISFCWKMIIIGISGQWQE